MVEWPSPRSLGCRSGLRLLRLATELHAAHALSDAGYTRGPSLRRGAGSLVALARSLVTAVCTLLLQLRLLRLAAGNLPSTVGLRILISRGWGLLRVLLRIASVGGRLMLTRWDAVLLSANLRLATGGGIGSRADLKGLGGITSLLLLACRGGSSILLGDLGLSRLLELLLLLLLLLARELAVPVVGRSRHGWRRGLNRRRTGRNDGVSGGGEMRRRALQRGQALSRDRVGAGFGGPRPWGDVKAEALSCPRGSGKRTEMWCATQLGFRLVERFAERAAARSLVLLCVLFPVRSPPAASVQIEVANLPKVARVGVEPGGGLATQRLANRGAARPSLSRVVSS